MLEIGNLLCKPYFIMPTYKKISVYHHQLVASSEIEIVKYTGYPVGVTMKYHKIDGHVNVKIFRTLFDSKMAATFSGAGEASC